MRREFNFVIDFEEKPSPEIGMIAVKGDKGNTGNGIASATLNPDYTLTLTFTDGTSYTTAPIRGEQGVPGDDGHSPVVTATKSGKVTTISVDNIVIATVNDGIDGQNGNDGNDGETPVKGTDYWTPADKAEIVEDVLEALPAAETEVY